MSPFFLRSLKVCPIAEVKKNQLHAPVGLVLYMHVNSNPGPSHNGAGVVTTS